MDEFEETFSDEAVIDDAIDEIIENLNSEDLAAAMDTCRRVLALAPDYPPAIYLMGLVAQHSGNLGLAIDLVSRAHDLDPECSDFPAMLAVLEANAGRLSDSLYHAKLATVLAPHPRHHNLTPAGLPTGVRVFDEVGLSRHRLVGEVALDNGAFDQAVHEAEIELHINPENLEAMILAARARHAQGHIDQALDHLHAAVHLLPHSVEVKRWLGDVLLAAGRHDEALAVHRQAIALDPDDIKLAGQVLAGLSWQTDANHAFAAPFADTLRGTIETIRKPRRVSPMGVDHIGMIWDETYAGPLLDFVLPALGALEDVIFYRVNRRADAGTEAVRTSVLRFVDVVDLDAATIERIIGGDGPRLLVNLCGGGANAKFPLLTGNPETGSLGIPRLQWLGFPMPDRLPGVDAVIGSAETVDLDERIFGAGGVITLRHLLTWRFPATGVEEEQVGPSPRETRKFVTFGAIGDMRRIGADTAALWAAVLLATPDSQLVLSATGEWQKNVTQRLFELFANLGVSNRIELQPQSKSAGVNLDFYARIDVMLDTAPVNGMEDVAQALWMGVPVVSLRGARRGGRTGAAILTAAGRPEWIATDEAAFAATAAALGADAGLPSIRAGLREQIAAAPLCDSAKFAVDFKQALLGFAQAQGSSDQ